MKQYLAVVGALCAVALTVTVALMIGPMVWSTLLGILFGGLASLPMLIVVLLLLDRRSGQPRPTVAPQQPNYQPSYMDYPHSPSPRNLRQGAGQLPAADWPLQNDEEDYIEADYYYQPARGNQ